METTTVLRGIKRTLLWAGGALSSAALLFGALLLWPDPLFAFSLGTGKIIIASDRPIPSAGGERFLRDCEILLERSPLKATGRQYRIYVANENWRQRFVLHPPPRVLGDCLLRWFWRRAAFMSGANFETGRVVHWGYVSTPPRTLASLCAHELTHIIVWEYLGLARLGVPRWVWEGLPDYVGIDNGRSFEELRAALGERPVDIPMMVKYGFYPRYRLLVMFFLEKKGWSVNQLLQTRLTEEEATAIMRAAALQ